jgi:hypothetical protein
MYALCYLCMFVFATLFRGLGKATTTCSVYPDSPTVLAASSAVGHCHDSMRRLPMYLPFISVRSALNSDKIANHKPRIDGPNNRSICTREPKLLQEKTSLQKIRGNLFGSLILHFSMFLSRTAFFFGIQEFSSSLNTNWFPVQKSTICCMVFLL